MTVADGGHTTRGHMNVDGVADSRPAPWGGCGTHRILLMAVSLVLVAGAALALHDVLSVSEEPPAQPSAPSAASTITTPDGITPPSTNAPSSAAEGAAAAHGDDEWSGRSTISSSVATNTSLNASEYEYALPDHPPQYIVVNSTMHDMATYLRRSRFATTKFAAAAAVPVGGGDEAPTTPLRQRLAVCFFGLYHADGKEGKAWKRGRAFIESSHGVAYDVFVSTWDYIAEKVVGGTEKTLRAVNKTWFPPGRVVNVTTMAKELRGVYGASLRGYHVADHTSIASCPSMFCVVSVVRANCLHAIRAAEKAAAATSADAKYPYFLVTRADHEIGLPLRIRNCPEYPSTIIAAAAVNNSRRPVAVTAARPTAAAGASLLGQQPPPCEMGFGSCMSFFRGTFYPAIVPVVNDTVIFPIAYSRPVYKSANYFSIKRWFALSDMGALGTRRSVARVLTTAVAMAEQMPEGWGRLTEFSTSRAAESANVRVEVVNSGLSGYPPVHAISGLAIDENITVMKVDAKDCQFAPRYLLDSCTDDLLWSQTLVQKLARHGGHWSKKVLHSCCTKASSCASISGGSSGGGRHSSPSGGGSPGNRKKPPAAPRSKKH